jgi:hypothetical protein
LLLPGGRISIFCGERDIWWNIDDCTHTFGRIAFKSSVIDGQNPFIVIADSSSLAQQGHFFKECTVAIQHSYLVVEASSLVLDKHCFLHVARAAIVDSSSSGSTIVHEIGASNCAYSTIIVVDSSSLWKCIVSIQN